MITELIWLRLSFFILVLAGWEEVTNLSLFLSGRLPFSPWLSKANSCSRCAPPTPKMNVSFRSYTSKLISWQWSHNYNCALYGGFLHLGNAKSCELASVWIFSGWGNNEEEEVVVKEKCCIFKQKKLKEKGDATNMYSVMNIFFFFWIAPSQPGKRKTAGMKWKEWNWFLTLLHTHRGSFE